jgi:catechol 2,3-dioxygenase-like lactoylglutathione lyase family enzyme
MRGSIHHLDLTVKDPWASREFYAQVLGFMGYRQIAEDDRGFDFAIPGHSPSVGLKAAEGPNRERAHDRYSPGLHHLAWRAQSRADVDGLYGLLLRTGATILDAPADYPQYGDGYYAVFFSDPDGLKLEFVFEP